MAIIERPKGHTVELLLKDDGIGPDMRKDDGVYTAHFSQFNGTGRYAVTARVVNDGKAYLKLRTSEEELWQGSSAALSKSAFLHLQTRYLKLPEVDVPLGEFQRTTDAGSFRVTVSQSLKQSTLRIATLPSTFPFIFLGLVRRRLHSTRTSDRSASHHFYQWSRDINMDFSRGRLRFRQRHSVRCSCPSAWTNLDLTVRVWLSHHRISFGTQQGHHLKTLSGRSITRNSNHSSETSIIFQDRSALFRSARLG